MAVAIAALSLSWGQAVPASAALLGEWRFAETDGQSALDGGPLGLDGRLGTTPNPDPADPQRIDGVADGALRFRDGAFVRLPNVPDVTPQRVTVEAVVRADRSPGLFRYVFSRGGWDCFAGSFGLYSGAGGGIAFYVFDGERYALSPGARPSDVWNGNWHHVAGVFDGESVQLYLDGRPVGTPTRQPLLIDYVKSSPGPRSGSTWERASCRTRVMPTSCASTTVRSPGRRWPRPAVERSIAPWCRFHCPATLLPPACPPDRCRRGLLSRRERLKGPASCV